MLKPTAKCWISAFNAQGLRLIIVAIQVGAVKIYIAAVEALRKKERQGETQETNKNWWFSEFHRRPWLLMYFFFLQVFFESHLVYDQTRGTHPVFSWLYGYLYCTPRAWFLWDFAFAWDLWNGALGRQVKWILGFTTTQFRCANNMQ